MKHLKSKTNCLALKYKTFTPHSRRYGAERTELALYSPAEAILEGFEHETRMLGCAGLTFRFSN